MKSPIKAGDVIEVRIYRFADYKKHPAVQGAWIPAFVHDVSDGKFRAFIPELGETRDYPMDSEDWRFSR